MTFVNTQEKIEEIAYILCKADNEYRGFNLTSERPLNVDSDWYFDNIDGWPWYMHMAEDVLKLFK